MASKKVISVNESSLVDLKAELYRKETQLKREKVDSNQPKKAPIWQKKKKEQKRKDGKTATEKTTSTDSSYDKELEKSRLMLEAKSELYNKLSTGEIEVPSDEDEQDGRFLVDFHQKTLPKNVDNEDKNIIDSAGQEIPPAVSPDEEWVEYVDCFGRSKRCLRKDLPQMKEKDGKVTLKSLEESKLTLLSDDMRRELIRNKWEQEVQEALDKPVGPVHYQDVVFDETHDHGVGYYKFSKVEEERQEQQTALNKLRAQTEQQRSKREKLLEKRKAGMDARLAKIRERKQRKLHEAGVVDDTQKQKDKTEEISNENIEQETGDDESEMFIGDEEETGNDESEMFIGAMVERIRNKGTKIERSHLNEWERGKVDLEIFDKPKRKTPSYDPGSERNPDFAPPSFYANETKSFANKTKWKQEDKKTNIASDVEITKTQEPGESDVLNSQAISSTSMEPEHNLNQQEMCANNTRSLQYSTEWTPQTSVNTNYQPPFNNTNPYVQSTNPNVANTNPYVQNTFPNFHNTFPNVQSTNYNTNPNIHNTSLNPYNTLPNLSPPPIHTFPPPNLPPGPPPLFPLSYQLPPQYPPNIPYPPNYPPLLPSNQQYPNVPQ